MNMAKEIVFQSVTITPKYENLISRKFLFESVSQAQEFFDEKKNSFSALTPDPPTVDGEARFENEQVKIVQEQIIVPKDLLLNVAKGLKVLLEE